MPSAKDDASTDVETSVKKFADDMTTACATLRNARILANKRAADEARSTNPASAPLPDPPVWSFVLDRNTTTRFRTPAQQAQEVVESRAWVCWSAHMADKARHVVMKADGKVTWDAKKAFGADFETFKKLWAAVMSRHGLFNANGKDGWYEGDAFHLELSDAKITRTDERAKACLAEYARLSREQKKGRNEKFEKKYAKELKPYLDKYSDKNDKKSEEKKK